MTGRIFFLKTSENAQILIWKFRFTFALKLQRNFENSKKYHFSHIDTHTTSGTDADVLPILWNVLGVQNYILKKIWFFLLRATNKYAQFKKRAFFKQIHTLHLSDQKMCHMCANHQKTSAGRSICIYLRAIQFCPAGE